MKTISDIKQESFERWRNFKEGKSFAPYEPFKDRLEIKQEFEKLQIARERLMKDNLSFVFSEEIYQTGNYRCQSCIAFSYNHAFQNFNSSYILIDENVFLALEAPSSKNLNQFYRLLEELGIKNLVRLTAPFDDGVEKCYPYWEGRTALLDDQKHFQILSFRLLEAGEKRDLDYYVMETWPDNKGIPSNRFLNFIRSIKTGASPLACHCSAGVGRTGTFIAGFHLIETLEKKGLQADFSIERLVYQLSLQRPYMVASLEQYHSLYELCDYYLANGGNIC